MKTKKETKVTLMTPVTQAVEITKAELKREGGVVRERKYIGASSSTHNGNKLKAIKRDNNFEL